MNTARRVIERLGGVRPAARLLQLPVTTVHSWARSGVIPARRQGAVLRVARANGIALEPGDFFGEVAA